MDEHLPPIEELAAELGAQVRSQRIRLRLTQEELASAAGVARKAVMRLETGGNPTVHTLLAVLRAIGRADWVRTLAPAVRISPMELLRSEKPPARRVRARKNEK